MLQYKSVLRAGRDNEFEVHIPPEDLTIEDIRKQIPNHHFRRSLFKSMVYLLKDLLQVVFTYYIMLQYIQPKLNELSRASIAPFFFSFTVKFLVWNCFWIIQGCNGTALWVIAHECGHHAFSPYRKLNNILGFLLHSTLLVPYHSWRITHDKHHKHTNHLTEDTIFVPKVLPSVIDLMEETPITALAQMVLMFLFGWPAHLLLNTTSHQHPGCRANHFDPYSSLFDPGDATQIVLSDLGVLVMLLGLIFGIYQFGLIAIMSYYIYPYLWVNFWLLYITYLQHTDLRIPHYSAETWTSARGAIAAVDRDFGWVLNNWFHHINDSHVVHHLFTEMPFYEAIIVTRKYCRSIFGEMYVTDETPLWKSLWRSWIECRYVVPCDGIAIFRGPTYSHASSTTKT